MIWDDNWWERSWRVDIVVIPLLSVTGCNERVHSVRTQPASL